MITDPFRHNSWATLRLLEFCRDLEPDVLDATAMGTYGSIKNTLAHAVGTEELLAAMVEGGPSRSASPPYSTVDDLLERTRWLMERWDSFSEAEMHPSRLVQNADGQLMRLGTVLAEVVHHGNHHRSQVCTVLSTVDIVPPDLSGWAYGAWMANRYERRRRESV